MASISVGEGSNLTVVGCRRDRQEAFVRQHSVEKKLAPSPLRSAAWKAFQNLPEDEYKEIRDLRLEREG